VQDDYRSRCSCFPRHIHGSTCFKIQTFKHKQTSASGRVSEVDIVHHKLTVCTNEVPVWCDSRHFQLNAEKTELIWFGSHANISRLSGRDLSITIGSETIKPVNSVYDLGFRLDNKLNMKQHINPIARTCFYHLAMAMAPAYIKDTDSACCSASQRPGLCSSCFAHLLSLRR